jgi:hypothetical protein
VRVSLCLAPERRPGKPILQRSTLILAKQGKLPQPNAAIEIAGPT